MIFIVAFFSWIALSAIGSFLTNPVRWYLLMSNGHFPQLTRFVPVPCFFALVGCEEKRVEEEMHAESLRDLQWGRWIDKLFMFSLPERIRFLRMSRVCAASAAENAEEFDPFYVHVRWLDDSPKQGTHRCHEVTGAHPKVPRISMFLEILGYENIVHVFGDHETYGRQSSGCRARTRTLVSNCRNFEEADAVSSILQHQIDEDKDLDPAKWARRDDWDKKEVIWNVKRKSALSWQHQARSQRV